MLSRGSSAEETDYCQNWKLATPSCCLTFENSHKRCVFGTFGKTGTVKMELQSSGNMRGEEEPEAGDKGTSGDTAAGSGSSRL